MMEHPTRLIIQNHTGRIDSRAAVAVVPLVDKTQGEDDLSGRTPYQKGQWHGVIMEEGVYECRYVMEHHAESQERKRHDDNADSQRHLMPYAFDVEVPYIYVVGDDLTKDNGEVVAEPSVDEKEDAARKAAYPIGVGRDHLFGLLREYPLYEHSCGEEALGDEADGIYI